MKADDRLILALLAVTWIVSACGSSDGTQSADSSQTPTRGALVGTTAPAKVASYSSTEMLSMMSDSGMADTTANFLQSVFTLECSVDVYQLRYQTVGAQGEPTTASGALMLPSGPNDQCQGSRPIAMYAHGTSTLRSYNIADFRDSDNLEGILIAAAFAARGYIVVAPNYAGYDTSTLDYHPFLNADQQSKDMIDALTAARTAVPMITQNVTDSGKLFITGYSQGGYVAMATHRALQAAGQVVSASAPMSGPYALAAFGDAIFQGRVSTSAPVNVTLLTTSYQRAYGNIYSNVTDAFEARYASSIDSLLPSNVSTGDLYAQGKLPRSELFNSTPPDPLFAQITPATDPANLATVFAKGFGTNNLITNNYRLAALQDALSSPDGGFPTTTTGVPAANPANALRQGLKLNDLRNWSPTAPVLLCAGNLDPVVFYFNTQLMQAYWTANRPSAPVTVLDVDSSASSADPYSSLKQAFSVAKDVLAAIAVVGGAKDGGQSAVLDAYHGLVAPFCLAAVASFFDSYAAMPTS
jgi:alpha/beta superfamily hydrolase